jgi:hypothetical protein
MLKRPVVSLFHSLKSTGKRYYWEQPKNNIINQQSFNKKNYNITENLVYIKNQENQIKEFKDELTNQKKVFENINLNVKNVHKDVDTIYLISLINIAINFYNYLF